jgi:hypothetical protein
MTGRGLQPDRALFLWGEGLAGSITPTGLFCTRKGGQRPSGRTPTRFKTSDSLDGSFGFGLPI